MRRIRSSWSLCTLRALAIAAATLTAASMGCAADRAAPVVAAADAAPAAHGASTSRILTFGGGSSPANSQASLEQNVLYFRRVLEMLGLDGVHHDVYFTDGTSTGRTVQVRVKPGADVELREMVAEMFGDDRGDIELQFRASTIKGLAGPSLPTAIDAWFDSTGKGMNSKDHLLVYFTGHGAPLNPRPRGTRGPAAPPAANAGTVLETWNDTSINTRDFITRLDKLNPEVEVTLVMVQCFSGGFANVIYNGGDPAKGLSKSKRCGFFSTVATRMAAGCTADIDGDDYEEFSTSFFAALSGKSRGGKAVEKPDYDKDGATSFAEAFTYVLLTSNTIDIPMMTSDQLLRDKSKFARGGDATMLGVDAPYAAILAAASPSEKAALEGLSTQLGLTGDGRLAAARKLATDIDRERVDLQKVERDSETAAMRARMPIRQMLAQRWPEFAVRWHPDVAGVLAKESKQVQDAIVQQPSYKAWEAAQAAYNKASDRDYDLERKWVKVERFITRAEAVILAANLEKVATPEIVQGYHDLVARENQSLTAWK